MQPKKILDLFSGIGGFSLGLERAGPFETVAFCEIDDYCQRVLTKHWPGVPIHDDIKHLKGSHIGYVDIICGGFPCQDISQAGKGAGLKGERSGLWSEFRRLIDEIRPEWVIIENVPAILTRGGTTVVEEIAAIGYDCMWECIPASAIGALHRRDRWWCICHARRPLADAKREGKLQQEGSEQGQWQRISHRSKTVADTDSNNQLGWSSSMQMGWKRIPKEAGNVSYQGGIEWAVEPDVGRVAHGIPNRVDRLKGLGNSIVPQMAEIIGRAINDA